MIDLLLILFVVLQIGDAYTTYTVLNAGAGREKNPIGRFVFDKIGLLAGIVLIKTVGAGIVLWIVLQLTGLLQLGVIVLLNVASAYVVHNNYGIMRRL